MANNLPSPRKRLRKATRRDRTRHRLFVKAYLDVGSKSYLNCLESAKIAGYAASTVKGYSYKLLDSLGIQEEMQRVRASRSSKSTIATPEEVLEVLTAQMRTTPEVFVDENGAIVRLKAGEKDRAVAVAGIKEKSKVLVGNETEGVVERTIEYKLVDRQKAAVELAKHHGLFEKDNEQQKPDTPLQLVAMPTGPMSLEEWTQQAQVILAKGKKQEAQPAGA